MMRRKLDLSALTEEEAEHVLQVVQRDMRLRKTEEERLSDLKQELDEEDSRCVLLSRQQGFNQRCCIRCCSPFTFLLKPRRRCLDCNYNICKRCCSYSSTEKGWLCSACEKSRLLKTQSLEWFYSNVRRRFKRFGSAKVLKTLYRRHIAEQGRDLAELTEESTYDESLGNDDSMYESDTTFYKHSEEHSMAETISVALRVAEEAIDEAIAKAESHTNNQEKQNEASYLRDNRGELIEELTTTIVQKIIRRKKEESETQPESTDWPPDQKTDVNFPSSPTNRPRSAMASQSSPKVSIWRSRSALSLLTDEKRHQNVKSQQRPVLCKDCTQGLKKDGVTAPTLPSWKSVDRMDTSILQSPDGNWIALQSTQLSRPSLLTKRKSLVFSVLEKESGVVSAYDGMGSDTEPDADGGLGAALLEIRQKVTSNNVPYDLQSSSPEPNLKSLPQTAAGHPQTNSDQNTPAPKFNKSPFPFLKRKVPLEYKRLSCQRLSVLDVNFNPEGTESSEDGLEDSRVKRTRRRRRTKREDTDVKGFSALPSAEPDYSRILLDVVVKHRNKRQGASDFLSDNTMDTTTSDIQSSEVGTPDACELENNHLLFGSGGNQLTSTLRELNNKVSQTEFSCTEDELDRVEEIVGEGNDHVEKEREGGRGEALWDMEVDMKKESVLEKEDCGEQRANEKLSEVSEKNQNCQETLQEGDTFKGAVEEGKVGCKTENSGKLTTDMNGDHQQRTAENPQKESTDLKSMVAGEPIETEDINSTNPEEEIKTTEDTAGYRERVEEVVEGGSQEKHDKMEPAQVKRCTSTEQETQQEPEKQIILETEKQREVDGERKNKNENQEDDEQTEEMENTASTGEDASVDDARFGTIDETEQDSCGNQAITGCQSEESEVEYERRTDSAIKALDNTQKDTEALDSKMRISRSDDTERTEDEEEIVAQEKNETEMMIKSEEREEHIEVEQDREKMSFNKQTQERFVEEEDESKHDLVEKTEEFNCVGRAEECDCKEHIFKEDLNSAHYGQEVYLTPEEIYKKYTAASLRSITTEVLKVLNATEDLIQGAIDDGESQSKDLPVLPPAQSKRLDEQLSRLEENVYVAASAVFGLEVQLDDLEECARSISTATSEGELTHLEEQVATVAAHVQQSDLKVTDIAARIAALKNAGLNVAPQTRFAKPQTIDSSRQHRRRLPAPPMQDKKA